MWRRCDACQRCGWLSYPGTCLTETMRHGLARGHIEQIDRGSWLTMPVDVRKHGLKMPIRRAVSFRTGHSLGDVVQNDSARERIDVKNQEVKKVGSSQDERRAK